MLKSRACRRRNCAPGPLRLTRADRARVAEELLSSLEESNEEVARAWATELEISLNRLNEIVLGRHGITAEVVKEEVIIVKEVPAAPDRPFTVDEGRTDVRPHPLIG